MPSKVLFVGNKKRRPQPFGHCAPKLKRPIHTRDFAPGACSRGTLREQSSSVCTNDFMGILHPREQNFHPAKYSTKFNRLNIWEQAPGQIERTWKRSLVCTDTCKMSLEHAPGAKPFVCAFTIAFFAAVNHNYDHKQRTLKHRNTQNGSKSTNHKSQSITVWTR